MNTPEVNYDSEKGPEFYAVEGFEFTKYKLPLGKKVQLLLEVDDKDRHERLLAHVFIGNEHLNYTLVREGYAEVMTIAPNDLYQDAFEEAELKAKQESKGIWSQARNWFGPPTFAII